MILLKPVQVQDVTTGKRVTTSMGHEINRSMLFWWIMPWTFCSTGWETVIKMQNGNGKQKDS